MAVADRSIDPRILESARTEFLASGFEKASLKTICEGAGVTTGALYKRYKGKEELFCAVVEQTVSDLYEVAHARGDKDPTAMSNQELIKAWDMDGADMMWWFRFLYDRRDDFYLLLSCSQGTRYANFPHDWVELLTKATSAYLAEEAFLLGKSAGMQWKISRRKGNFILYMKESEQIEDFLTWIGATKATLKLMDIKIVKGMRNKVNRATNCETANLDKTVSASRSQVADIAYIKERRGLSYLDEELRPLAELRLENPECSLRELAAMLNPPLSRSGVNHRLKRIQQAAQELRANTEEKDVSR